MSGPRLGALSNDTWSRGILRYCKSHHQFSLVGRELGIFFFTLVIVPWAISLEWFALQRGQMAWWPFISFCKVHVLHYNSLSTGTKAPIPIMPCLLSTSVTGTDGAIFFFLYYRLWQMLVRTNAVSRGTSPFVRDDVASANVHPVLNLASSGQQ